MEKLERPSTVVPESEPRQPASTRPLGKPRCGPEGAISCLLTATQELNASADLSTGLRKVAETLKHYIDYDTFAVLLLDDLGKELRFEFATGISPEVARHWRFGMGQGIVGTAASTRQAVLVGDVRQEPRYINASDLVRSELAIPLLVKDRTVGVLDIGSSRLDYFTPEDQRLLSFLGGHLANAVETARLHQNMRDQASTLSLLHEVSRDLASILDREELVERVAELVRRLIDYDLLSVLIWNEESRTLDHWMSFQRDGARLEGMRSIPLGYGITGAAAALRQAIRVPNVELDPRYVDCGGDLEVRSELVVPLIFKDRLLGVLDLESAAYDAFSSRHEQLLSTLASSLAISLENARLYEMLRDDEQRLEQDLSTARELQKQLLPTRTPWIPGLQLAVASEPAKHLGGDFHDFIPYAENSLGIALGDVAGKATSAALYGALAFGTLRQLVAQARLDPARVLQAMNEKLHQLDIDSRFVAMAFGVYDHPSRRLSLANSGLPYPFLLRDGRVTRIEVGGVPLGMLPDRSYPQVKIDLSAGDAVVVASDGIEESLDHQESEFGKERTASTLRRLASGSAQEIADGLLAAAQAHSGALDPSDDRTVVVLKAI